MHVATSKIDPRATRRASARSGPTAPRRPTLSGRDRAPTGRQPDGGHPMGAATPGWPPGTRGPEEPPQVGAPPSAHTTAVARTAQDPQKGGDPLRLRDRALDPPQDSRRHRPLLWSALPYGLPLGQTAGAELVGAGPGGPSQ